MAATRVNPLPSLIRASAYDAGNARMRSQGRSKWNRADFNESAAVQEKLIRTCYWREGDDADSPWPFIRFSIAEQAERDGLFDLHTDMGELHAAIDAAIAQADAQPVAQHDPAQLALL